MEFKLRNTIKDYNPESYVKEGAKDEFPIDNDFDLIDCSLGVNPFGHSSYINNYRDHIIESLHVSSYPPFPFINLKREIIKYWKNHCSLKENNIKFGTGSIGILLTINRLFIDKGTLVLGIGPTFTPYSSDVRLCEGIFHHVLLNESADYKFDVDKFISKITPKYALVYIDNPNNPTGQVIDIQDIKRVVAKTRENNVCVVIDEAYGDFMDNGNSAVNLINSFKNLIVVRTFSKGFGLAGLRVGYLIANDYLSDMYSKVDSPFTINNVGYSAAITSLRDRDFILNSRKKISEVKDNVISAFNYMRVLETNNEVPIMTIELPHQDINLYNLFRAHGVLTESGDDFTGLGRNFVRMRIPNDPYKLSEIISKIENNFLNKVRYTS